ncbi:MAG: protein-L-isoaspartate(D-aspartate) O-methyltransferase [Verrucomicrobiota bacterium]
MQGSQMNGEPSAARRRMVREQITARGVSDPRVIAAMESVPRHEFVPEDIRVFAHDDRPLPIGHGQTISQPYIVAFMIDRLALQPGARVLEIGTGGGYQAAVLAKIAAEVFTIEIVAPLAERAKNDLRRLGYQNVHVKHGDGHQGWPEEAPFDGIIAACAPDQIPPPLVAQLAEGERLVIPVGGTGAQELRILEKRNGTMELRDILPVRFVPMTGGNG